MSEQHTKKAKNQTKKNDAVPERQFDSSALEEKKEEKQTSMPAAPAASPDASLSASPDASQSFDQFKRYDTCDDMVAALQSYYRSNPNEWTVGVMQSAKGARFTAAQLIDFMVAWAAWMEENNKLYNSPRKMDMAFRRWVLNQKQVPETKPEQTGTQQQTGAKVAAKAKHFQFI